MSSDKQRWTICDGCGQTFPHPGASIHHGTCTSDDWRDVMPVKEHREAMDDATVTIQTLSLNLVSQQREHEALREAAKAVVSECHADSGASLSRVAIQALRAALEKP